MGKGKTPLTQDRLRELLHYDPSTGVFTWRVKRKGVDVGDAAGTKQSGYLSIMIDYKRHYAHRLAWFYITGDWPPCQIDHANGDRLDNRFANLRLADRSENQHNRGTPRNNTSGFKCVYWLKNDGVWLARVQKDNRQIHLGRYSTRAEASKAYVDWAKNNLKGFARVA